MAPPSQSRPRKSRIVLPATRLLRFGVGESQWPHWYWLAPGSPGKPPGSRSPQPQPRAIPLHGTSSTVLWTILVLLAKPEKIPGASGYSQATWEIRLRATVLAKLIWERLLGWWSARVMPLSCTAEEPTSVKVLPLTRLLWLPVPRLRPTAPRCRKRSLTNASPRANRNERLPGVAASLGSWPIVFGSWSLPTR